MSSRPVLSGHGPENNPLIALLLNFQHGDAIWRQFFFHEIKGLFPESVQWKNQVARAILLWVMIISFYLNFEKNGYNLRSKFPWLLTLTPLRTLKKIFEGKKKWLSANLRFPKLMIPLLLSFSKNRVLTPQSCSYWCMPHWDITQWSVRR